MKFKPLFGRTQKQAEPDIAVVIQDTRKRLILLKKKYQAVLHGELIRARDNRDKGIRNSGNYSRIGIAYYSLNVIHAAEQRLEELSSSQELHSAMQEMGALLGTINGMPKKIGGFDPGKIVGQMKKMSGASGGASSDLLKTLESLSTIPTERRDTISTDALVSVDVIERLINGENVEHCVNHGDGLVQPADEVMSLFSEALDSGELSGQGGAQEMSMEEINEMLSGL